MKNQRRQSVVPSTVRNLSYSEPAPKQEGFLAALGMTEPDM
jgi:hypothetical protein